METELISDKQAISIMVLFIMGSTLILGTGAAAKKDTWLAIIMAVAAAILLSLVYARLLSLFPGKDLFEILRLTLGNVAGSCLMLLYFWYIFHNGSLVLRNFGEFITVIAMPETPMIVPSLCLGLLCAYMVKTGIETLGRFSEFFIIIVLLSFLITLPLAFSDMKFSNLQPSLAEGIKPVIQGAFASFSFPFAETVAFTMVFNGLTRKSSAFRIYPLALFISGAAIFLVSIRNIAVLGSNLNSSLYFPSYTAVSLINIGHFLQRTEIIVGVVLVLAGFVKISICLLAACNGITKIFNCRDYRFLVFPVAVLMVLQSIFIYTNIMQMKDWAFNVWPFYSLPFQVFIPLIVWIIAELKVHMGYLPKGC